MGDKRAYLIDMDGVLLHGDRAIPGASDFIDRLAERGHPYLILTNNSRFTPQDLQHRLSAAGIAVDASRIYSSALATASFVQSQRPGGSAFVLGGSGLYQAMHDVGYTLADYHPDYVILGEVESHSYDGLIRATQHVMAGVPFIATNPDLNGPAEQGIIPACGAVAALIEKASGYTPYYVGKPNPLIMRLALRYLGVHSENAVMVGDNMYTDIRVGLESGLQTVLVLTGVTKEEAIKRFPYRPGRIVPSVAEIDP